ncbi:hypothetical protein [Treponema ruminis]|uniref:Uncharacterized protein n=1 Tax=Treponema ruminis TaxID=744515 RepID=A0A7W8G6V2_9SPIR|nr:hypothetical protein [Treponema ruminis]MBB5224923.1 hypothetical protein [Treponema ruminis]
MYRHPFRKSFGLIVLYSIIIIGIFVLQFRNESVVSKNIGLLSISFAQSQNEAGEVSLKNSLQVAFKGISFIADEVNPAQLYLSPEEGFQTKKNLTLLSYEQRNPLSYTFNFTEGVSLTFAVTGTDSSAAFSITASLPPESSGLYLNYKPSSGFSVTEKTRTKLILNSKNLTYAFTASSIDEHAIFLSSKNFVANYVAYNPSIEFSFESIDSDMIIAQKSTYDTNIRSLRSNLVTSVSESIKNNQTLSEKSVIAYVAEMASQGRYTEAVENVPDSFKKGNKRTYLSAPYFNTLTSMYPTLEMYTNNMAEMVANAIESSSLSIFSVNELADYINILPDSSNLRSLLALPSRIFEDESTAAQVKLSQATGVLNTYLRLSSLHSSYADILLPSVEKCLKIIESACVLNDSLLTLTAKDVTISNYLAILTGNSLIRWGDFNNASEYSQAGYAIINSILSLNSLDSITMADVYPILVDNPFYPHNKVLSRTPGGVIWAWTCAPSISYSAQANSATISINFPKNEINYIIVNGIISFSEIEIYGLSFHSDPRFESYNSSGFIYDDTKNALFLKSRHKSETEIVRLTYGQ